MQRNQKNKISQKLIRLPDFELIIVETANPEISKVTKEGKKCLQKELLTILFGEKFSGWFQGFRQIYAIALVPVLFLVVALWLVFVGYLLWCAAFSYNFYLSDGVLVVLITSTTTAVLGLFHFANRWLYSADTTSKDKPDSQ